MYSYKAISYFYIIFYTTRFAMRTDLWPHARYAKQTHILKSIYNTEEYVAKNIKKLYAK